MARLHAAIPGGCVHLSHRSTPMPKITVVDYIVEQKEGHTAFIGQSAKTGKTYKLSKVMLRLSPEAIMGLADDLITTLETFADNPEYEGEIDIGVAEDTTHLIDAFAKYNNKNPFPSAKSDYNLVALLAASFGIDGSRLSSNVKQKPHRPVKGPQPAG